MRTRGDEHGRPDPPPLRLLHIGEHIPPEFIKDRKEDYLYVDISKAAMAPELPQYRQRVSAQYAWLKASLADGRAFARPKPET